jgi:predicted amidohydrolase YtcJ
MKLLYNAFIYTQDPAHPTESAILIDRDRIVTVGEANVLLPEYPNAEKQNMEGRVILPGLTDAHLHLRNYALSLHKVDCETDTKEECLRRVAGRF